MSDKVIFPDISGRKPKSSQRRTIILSSFVILGLASIGLLASTIILALRLNGAYPSARVDYHVWNNENLQNGRNQMKINAPKNATLFSVMEHAALEKNHFEFEYKQFEFGKYIYSIGGVSDNTTEDIYWMIYKIPNEPNTDNPPSDEFLLPNGVDFTRVNEGDIYLFWLKKVKFEHNFQKLLKEKSSCLDNESI